MKYDRVNAFVMNVFLDNAKQLNALKWEQVQSLNVFQKSLYKDSHLKVLFFKAVKKPFCAGGDIVSLYKAYLKNDKQHLRNFFYHEHSLCYRLATMEVRKLFFIDFSKFKSRFGMEISWEGELGLQGNNLLELLLKIVYGRCLKLKQGNLVNLRFVVDVGSSFILSRLKKHLGMYLALSAR